MKSPLAQCAVAGCLALLAFSSSSDAQRPEIPRESVRGNAKLKAYRGDLLHVQDGEGTQLLLKVTPQTKEVAFAGSADASWLQPGMWVRFTGRFNKKGQPLSAVRDLTVFTPREDTRIGVFPDSNLGGGALFEDQGDKKPQDDSASYLVSGRLAALRGGKMTVSVGNAALKVELDEAATVKLELADYRLARAGDSIHFEGWHYPMMKNQIFVGRLEITASEPFTGEKKPKPRAPGASGDQKTPGEGDQPDEKKKPGEGEKPGDGEKDPF